MPSWIAYIALWVILIVGFIIHERWQRRRNEEIHQRTLVAGQQWIDCQQWTDDEKAHIRSKGFTVK